MDVSVYHFQEPHVFLQSVLSEKQRTNPRYSLRAWAKHVGVEATSLSRILRGERKLSLDLAVKVAENLGLKEKEKRYFEILVLLENAKSDQEKELYSDILKSLWPANNINLVAIDRFRLISDWYHLAILEMTELKDFQSDPKWIAKSLGEELTPSMVEEALSRLIRLDLLVADKKGKLQRVARSSMIKVGDEGPSEAVQKYHLQVVEKAKKAIRSIPENERDFRATTLTIKQVDFKKAADLLRQCHNSLSQLSARGGDETYQISSQIFPITNGRKKS